MSIWRFPAKINSIISKFVIRNVKFFQNGTQTALHIHAWIRPAQDLLYDLSYRKLNNFVVLHTNVLRDGDSPVLSKRLNLYSMYWSNHDGITFLGFRFSFLDFSFSCAWRYSYSCHIFNCTTRERTKLIGTALKVIRSSRDRSAFKYSIDNQCLWNLWTNPLEFRWV